MLLESGASASAALLEIVAALRRARDRDAAAEIRGEEEAYVGEGDDRHVMGVAGTGAAAAEGGGYGGAAAEAQEGRGRGPLRPPPVTAVTELASRSGGGGLWWRSTRRAL